MILLTILVFIIVLGLLVFVHELGHFIMAKRAGMTVEEFGFGFPPRIFGFKRGETTYSINWIPLGGFVRILGEDGSDHENPMSFGQKSGWRRFSVLIAGVVMNLILAWVLVSIGMAIGLPTVIDEGDVLPASAHIHPASVGILDVEDGTPAATAGVRIGDFIVKINGQAVTSIDQVQTLTKQLAGKPSQFEFKRGSEVIDDTITPRLNPPAGQGALGIALGSVATVSYPWYQAPWRGLVATYNLVYATLSAFGMLISQAFHGQSIAAAVSGPVGVAVLTSEVTQLGFIYILQFTAVLSINLAIINAVPFPALDGGRILFLVIEKIRRKKLPVKAEQIANTTGFALLLLLMVFVTIHDFGKYDIIEKLKHLL